MSKPEKPSYNFKHPVFQKVRKYIRWAKEHIHLSEIDSDVIEWEVKETATALQIPTKYHIHYKIKSILDIDDHQNPIYSTHHVMEVTLPPGYPLEPCKIYMLTPIWHPNIKSGGRHRGRICGNVKNFGRTFDMYQLVLRIGEMLQYKNYHAVHVPPYPEDSTVAHWVTSFAEPKGIIDKEKEIYIDDTPLLNIRHPNHQEKNTPVITETSKKEDPLPPVDAPAPQEAPPTTPPPISESKPPASEENSGSKFKFGTVRKNQSKIRLHIKSNKKDSDE